MSEGLAIDDSDGSQKSEKLNTIQRQIPEEKSKRNLINSEAAAVFSSINIEIKIINKILKGKYIDTNKFPTRSIWANSFAVVLLVWF